MTVARKLQIPAASTVLVLGMPADVELEIPGDCLLVSEPVDADDAVVIAFLVRSEDLDDVAGAALTAAQADRLAWIAYPKSHQLGSDLTRDLLASVAEPHGVRPVRAVSISSVWSALRFRPLGP